MSAYRDSIPDALHTPVLDRILASAEFEEARTVEARDDVWRGLVRLMWDHMSTSARSDVFFNFMGKRYDEDVADRSIDAR